MQGLILSSERNQTDRAACYTDGYVDVSFAGDAYFFQARFSVSLYGVEPEAAQAP